MHQPFYKDLWNGQYKLPWTRLHALKDYAGMVEILGEFPDVHQTFNLVPSMVMQIDEYARGEASDAFFDCAVMPAESISTAQRAFIIRYFFQANIGRMIYRYPRYAELYEKRADHLAFSTQDLRDLQIYSQLVWFDEDVLAHDPELQELIRKGRDYSRADQNLLAKKQRAALARVLPVYREFASRGQIEISTTPFYHPILPLLCDSDIARVAHPSVTLPTRFLHPEDAREQLLRARSYMEAKLGVAPVGLWPSEGSVSDQALALAADCGFKWAGTDNGVLARTLEREAGAEVTYQAYEWVQQDRRMKMLFRDHYLSDLIGFEYSRMGPEEAARHFLSRIRDNTQGRDSIVPVILDGENAWEWYEANGRPFLHRLYQEISADPDLQALTVSEALERSPAKPLDRIFPGSWINANFDIWIGAEEDNHAWERLSEARAAYDKNKDSVPEDARKLAYEELLIAEGSDWCWWYGPEHGSDNRPEFDELYRDHLANVYRALGHGSAVESFPADSYGPTGRNSGIPAEHTVSHHRWRDHIALRMARSRTLSPRSTARRDARRRAGGPRRLLRLQRRRRICPSGWRRERRLRHRVRNRGRRSARRARPRYRNGGLQDGNAIPGDGRQRWAACADSAAGWMAGPRLLAL